MITTRTNFSNSVITNIYCALFIILLSMSSQAQNHFLDLSFCDTGTCELDIGIEDVFPIHMSFDSLENIYITSKGNFSENYLTKVDKNGQLDTNFGEQGLFIESEYTSYQKGNYIFSILDVDNTTIVNLYDLDLNFIQRYILDGSARFEQLHFDGNKFIGSTYFGSIFQYNADGTLDQDFATNGLYSIELPFLMFGIEGYLHTDTEGNHLGIKTDPIVQNRKLFKLSDTGEELWIKDIHQNNPILRTFLPLADDGILLATEGYAQPSTTLKYTSDGMPDETYGIDGVLQIQKEFEGYEFKSPVGYLNDDHMIISRSDNMGQAYNTVDSVFVMNNQGKLNEDFGFGGYLDMSLITGQAATIAHPPQTNVFYIASRTPFGLSGFYLTKINLEDLVNGPSDTQELSLDNNAPILLYPNPSHGDTQMLYSRKTLNDAQLSIQNVEGRVLSQEIFKTLKSDQVYNMKTTELESGLYIVMLSDGERVVAMEKLVVR